MTTEPTPPTGTTGRHRGTLARPPVSFEFFPPKTAGQISTLRQCAARLAAFEPSFISVTYGAGGTTQKRSLEAVRALIVEDGLSVAGHLTCVGASRKAVNAVALDYWSIGSHHIVALRGDPPEGIGATFRPHPDGYRTSAELVAGLKTLAPFEISVSAYCERHPDSPDWKSEIEGLKRKVDAGANRAITQFFYGDALYESYCERVRAAGIDIPIVPGILPVHDCGAVQRFAARCGAGVPDWLIARFSGLQPGSPEAVAAAVELVVEQMDGLSRRGADAFHFFALNRSDILVPALKTALAPARQSAA